MIHRFLNICKGGRGAQNSDTAWYYCSGEAHRTRDGAIEARRYLENVVATAEVNFEEELIYVDDPPQFEIEAIINATCPHCATGDIPSQRLDTGEWTHFNEMKSGNSPVSIRQTLCLASFLRNSKFGKLING